jgi:hypothetical protein
MRITRRLSPVQYKRQEIPMPLLCLFGIKSKSWPQRARSCFNVHHNLRHQRPCFWSWSPYSPVRCVGLLEKLIGHTSPIPLFFILHHGMTLASRFLLMILLYWGGSDSSHIPYQWDSFNYSTRSFSLPLCLS